ncbi:ATP-dependent DNA helicase MER3 [Tilletia horrida]|nr:ATP-dependent DNA helicase MER3 [Tilletia horrida]
MSSQQGTVQAADVVAKAFQTRETERGQLPWIPHVSKTLNLKVIRGTKQYTGTGWAEMSDLDFVQMMGRAGRPQFDSEGVAVIMTEQDQKQHYLDLASGRTVIESSLAAELVEHVNAELVLRGTSSKQDIERWIEGTFLHVRLLKNPKHYNLDETSTVTKSSTEVMQLIVENALQQLNHHDLVQNTGQDHDALVATDFGDILAKYFLSFKTMLLLLEVPEHATLKDLLETLADADEFKDIRMRQGEKALFTTLSKHEEIRFAPAKVNGVREKIVLLLQAVLAGLSLQECLGSKIAGYSPTLDAFGIFRHAPRYGRALQNAFMLLRSINGRSWDGTPTALRQLDGVGEKTFKILAGAGLLTISEVAKEDPRRIEMLLNRNPPYGDKLVNNAKAFPHFHLNVEQVSEDVKDDGVLINIQVTAGLTDMGVKLKTARKESGVALSILKKISADKTFKVVCKLSKPSQRIVVTAACDEISGSAVRSELRHTIGADKFPKVSVSPKTIEDAKREQALHELEDCIEFFDDDDDIGVDEATHDASLGKALPQGVRSDTGSAAQNPIRGVEDDTAAADKEPERLPNGNYKEGMEKPPQKRKSAKKKTATDSIPGESAALTVLQRLQHNDGRPASRGQAPMQRRTGSSKGLVLPTIAPRCDNEVTQTSSIPRSPKPKPLVDNQRLMGSEEDEELPRLPSTKRKYDVDWTASRDIEADEDVLRPLRPQPVVKRAKINPRSFIDDEAGEDNRPEHVRTKRAGERAGSRRKALSTDASDSDEDPGSLKDFVVGDDVDPFLTLGDEGSDIMATDASAGNVSHGDLIDRDMDDLANLFTDTDDDVEVLEDKETFHHDRNSENVMLSTAKHFEGKSAEAGDGDESLALRDCGTEGPPLFFSDVDAVDPSSRLWSDASIRETGDCSADWLQLNELEADINMAGSTLHETSDTLTYPGRPLPIQECSTAPMAQQAGTDLCNVPSAAGLDDDWQDDLTQLFPELADERQTTRIDDEKLEMLPERPFQQEAQKTPTQHADPPKLASKMLLKRLQARLGSSSTQ